MLIRHAVVLPALVGLVTSACSGLYTLPDAPPREEWVDLGAAEPVDEQELVRRFLEAKRVAIAVYAAMRARDWATVLDNLSQETVAFLEDASGGAGAKAVLESGQLSIAGQSVEFDPAADFFIAELEQIEDEYPGQEESETPRRKELYVIDGSGRARKVVFILEADRWRFHSPFLKTPILEPPPAAAE